MAIRSFFDDEASIDVAGIWFVGRTTPILYLQPNPDELYFILGYDLNGIYPDRTAAQSGSEAVDPVDALALVAGTANRYISDFAIRAETSSGADDGMLRLQMAAASDSSPAAAQPFTADALSRAVLAIQARPSNTVYRINFADLVDSGGDFAWLDPESLRIGADVWSVVSAASEIRTVIFDPADAAIDGAAYLYDDAPAQAPAQVQAGSLASIFPGPPVPVAETANVLWIDIVTAGVRYGPLRDISSWQQEEIWNEGSRFSLTAVEKGPAAHVDTLSEIYVYSLIGGHVTLVGAGLALDFDQTPTETETTLALTGVGFEHELLRQPAVDLTFADTSHDNVVDALAALLPAGWSLMADPEIGGNFLSARIAGKSLLDAIRKCAEFFGTALEFGLGRVIRMRTYYTPLAIAASDDGGLGARIVRFKRRTQGKQIATVLHPFASDRKPRLSDATDEPPDDVVLDAAAGTVTHVAGRERYGELHQEHVFRSLVPDDENGIATGRTANLLLALAVNRLQQYAEPQRTYEIAIQAQRQMVRPFHRLPLQIRKQGVYDSFRVASVSTTYDQTNGLRQSMTLTSQQSVRLVDDASLLARRLRDLVEAVDLPATAAANYVGAMATPITSGEGVSLSFVAGPADDVEAIVGAVSVQSGAYQYAVDGGQWRSLLLGDTVDLSADVLTTGGHTLTVRLTPTPSAASILKGLVIVSG